MRGGIDAGAAPAARRREAAMNRDQSLRTHLSKLLDWQDAHINFDAAVEKLPAALRGIAPAGLPYSPWQLLEHLRICQLDILDFCRNPAYVEMPAEKYWPVSAKPSSEGAWEESVAAFRRDREELKRLAMDESIDLYATIPHGAGQTYLRELLLVADHNAYHVGQLVAVRRSLGAWSG
jgi:uncharacterized damage-inducible protein DinB